MLQNLQKGVETTMKFVLDREEWNRLVKDFPNWDIYYLYEYVHSLEMHGDGTPLLLYWKNSQIGRASGRERVFILV